MEKRGGSSHSQGGASVKWFDRKKKRIVIG